MVGDVRPLDPDLEGAYTCSLTSQPGPFSLARRCELYAARATTTPSRLALQASDGVHAEVGVTAQVEFVPLSEDAFKVSQLGVAFLC